MTAIVDVTRKYRFSSSHRLHSDHLSEQENDETYGKCNNPYGHGHNYELEVTVSAAVDGETGLAVAVPVLDAYINREIVRRYDHRNMNVDLPEYADLVPTTENVAKVIARQLCAGWSAAFAGAGPKLKRIRVHETRNNIFEVECQ